MANHKAAKKSYQTSLKSAANNRSINSRVKTFVKSLEVLLTEKKPQEARERLSVVESEMMKAVSKGVIKLNTASRRISRLSDRIKGMNTASQA